MFLSQFLVFSMSDTLNTQYYKLFFIPNHKYSICRMLQFDLGKQRYCISDQKDSVCPSLANIQLILSELDLGFYGKYITNQSFSEFCIRLKHV